MAREDAMHEIYKLLMEHFAAVQENRIDLDIEQACERAARALHERFRDLLHERDSLDKILQQLRDLRDWQRWITDRTVTSNDELLVELKRIAANNRTVCALRESEGEGGFTKLIIDGGPSLAAKSEGKRQHDELLRDWLSDAEEIIAIDPFLFKRERSNGSAETEDERDRLNGEYADALLDIVGGNRIVSFIYRGNPSKEEGGPIKVTPGVANRIADRLHELSLKANFYVVEDLHDRVWLKRTRHQTWSGRVIGTSRGGIGTRPTYMIDMPGSDVRDYWPYVDHLRRAAQMSHERPIDFKKKPPNKKSHSGKIKMMKRNEQE